MSFEIIPFRELDLTRTNKRKMLAGHLFALASKNPSLVSRKHNPSIIPFQSLKHCRPTVDQLARNSMDPSHPREAHVALINDEIAGVVIINRNVKLHNMNPTGPDHYQALGSFTTVTAWLSASRIADLAELHQRAINIFPDDSVVSLEPTKSGADIHTVLGSTFSSSVPGAFTIGGVGVFRIPNIAYGLSQNDLTEI